MAPTLTLAQTDGIAYSVDADAAVCAGSDGGGDGDVGGCRGRVARSLPAGWTRDGPTTATLTVLFAYGGV